MAKAAAALEDVTEKKRLALKAQSEDLSEARKALESAANIARGLWFTFMTLAAYLVIAVGSVTHRDLFLETPVRLPLLNAELPLVAFFWVAPLMFLVFHGYLLLNLKFLGDNVRHYFRLVDETGLDDAAKETLYLQLPNFMMVQLLRERRTTPWTLMGYALHAVVMLTVIIGPVLTLLFLQLRFLPYHDITVTMIQRLAIIVAMIQILYFWPGIAGPPATRRIWSYRMVMYGAMFAIVLFSGFVATFPGEWNYGSALVRKSGMADILLRGPYNEVTGDRQSWFSDTLSLSDQDFVDLDEAKLKAADATLSLRGRDLTEANLARADLRKADFSGANLKGAIFSGARLQNAVFRKPNPILVGKDRSVTEVTNLHSANFNNAKLAGASFNGSELQGAKFENADLEGASFERSVLHGASFVNAKLANAKFGFAVMKGAYFKGSDLASADFSYADLIGTVFVSSQLQGAKFAAARLDAAAMVSTNVFALTEDNAIQDAWLELNKTRRQASKVDWGSTLAYRLQSVDRPLLVKLDDPDFRVAGADAPAGGLGAPAADPAATAAEIGKKSVRLDEGAAMVDQDAAWRRRTERLVALICLDPEHGAGIYARVSLLSGENLTPLPPFGPYSAAAADILLTDSECWEILRPKDDQEKSGVEESLKSWAKGGIDPEFRSGLVKMLDDLRQARKARAAAALGQAASGSN